MSLESTGPEKILTAEMVDRLLEDAMAALDRALEDQLSEATRQAAS